MPDFSLALGDMGNRLLGMSDLVVPDCRSTSASYGWLMCRRKLGVRRISRGGFRGDDILQTKVNEQVALP